MFTGGVHEPAAAVPTPTTADPADATSSPAPATGVAPVLVIAGAASLGAGLVHAAAAGTHAGADTLVRLFAVTAALQVGWAAGLAWVAWAALAAVRPVRAVLWIGVLLNGGAAVAWALSRTQGLPWPAELEVVEEVGTQDLIAAILGGAAGAGALLAAVRPWARRPARRPLSGVAVLAGAAALVLAVPGMSAAHSHGPSHEHGHDDVAGEHTHGAATADGPVISLDDERVSEAQRAAAQALIDDTRSGMAPYPDVAAVEAAGYLSIGDGRTGHEHFVNYEYLVDGIELDPARIESVVFSVAADGTRAPVSAMYILSPGKGMDDVPAVAGELTTWHDHQNLCWEGARVVGTTDDTGTCVRGTFRGTPPMLHVWVVDNPCGPFAGLEGHGEDCSHSHD